MILLGKTFATLVTNVWPLAGMEFAVCHQMTLQWERTTALLANKWSLAAIIDRWHSILDEKKKEKKRGKNEEEKRKEIEKKRQLVYWLL